VMLPDYWLQRPMIEIDSKTRSDINQLFAWVKAAGTNTWIDYTFPIPKWQFLCYLADQQGVVLHGTGDPHIQVFEPRPSNDLNEFGAQTAVYAAGMACGRCSLLSWIEVTTQCQPAMPASAGR